MTTIKIYPTETADAMLRDAYKRRQQWRKKAGMRDESMSEYVVMCALAGAGTYAAPEDEAQARVGRMLGHRTDQAGTEAAR